ncbi:hypothetical protein BCV70DRAFT_149146, partial [Testicularia cyperi]
AASATKSAIFQVGVTQPVMCDVMNITFDPSVGEAPYFVMITVEDYWPVVVFLPESYDDASKSLWLYQWPVPTFNGPITNPNLIVSVSDLSGLVANSSSILPVQNNTGGATCSSYTGSSAFTFYTEQAASQCQDYQIVWNGQYEAPLDIVFLPELAPPINVPVTNNSATSMSWTVAMRGGTRFLMTMGDSNVRTGGVSKLNIVALNEYFSDACIAADQYDHDVLPAQTTASPATVFPDATSTIASLTTNNGVVATITVVQTIKNGRTVHKSSGGLSATQFLILLVVVLVSIGLGGIALGWFCYRRRQRLKHNIQSWDLPNNDPSVPFKADPSLPIAPGMFGRGMSRTGTAVSEHESSHRPSISAANSFDPVSLSARQVTHASSGRASLRSWTSSAIDSIGAAGMQQQTSSHHDYALINTGSVGRAGPGRGNGRDASTRSRAAGTDVASRNEALSPTDSVARTFSFYSDDAHRSLHNRSASPASAAYSDAGSVKSSRVGPASTYRPDAASQAAYQDLLTSSASPTGMLPHAMPTQRNHHGPPSASSVYHDGARSQPARGWRDVTSGQPTSSPQTRGPARVIRHADAGLLLDDTADDDGLLDFSGGQYMELPPQYDTIHPSDNANPQRPRYGNSPVVPRSALTHDIDAAPASGDISNQSTHYADVVAADFVDADADEAEFW